MRIIFLLLLAAIVGQVSAQSTIADARNKSTGSTVTISGVVTNGSEMGDIRHLQDATAGIAIYDTKLPSTNRGDSITITGELDDYNNLLEVKSISEYTKHTSSGKTPNPTIISIDNIGEDYEGQLIQLDNIELEDAGTSFAGGKNYNFSDGTNTGELRINSGSPIVGMAIPSGKISLVAICSQYSPGGIDTRDGYQLLPRDMNDFISGSSIHIISAVHVTDISKNSIRLTWETDNGGTPFVRYGNANNVSSLSNIKAGDSTTGEFNYHAAEITGLEPAEIVYAQTLTINGADTAFSAIGAYVSESNSSGKINAYFNSAIDESVATETIAKDLGNAMEDTLAAYINRAVKTIDFCIYNFNNDMISDALNAAQERGVTIRLITCESTSHQSIADLNSEIPVLERPEIQEGGIMHNKFVIFDANSSDANKPWVWSGSTNLTEGQLISDANNMIFIQDQSLAKTYKIEFEEMWGSTSQQANASKAKFGDDKSDNTPHELVIGGVRVESYFSPSDNTNQKLVDAIKTADKNLSVQTMLITRSELAYAITDAYERGVQVHVITDDDGSTTENVRDILNDALPNGKFIYDDRASGILHHKLAIIDANDSLSDPQLITGSHNWSLSANVRNDENTLIIHNSNIANQYFQQFAYRFEQNNGNLVVSAKEIQISDLKVFPNPTQNRLQISSNKDLLNIEIYTIQGKLVQRIIPTNTKQINIDLSKERTGIYILKVEADNNTFNTYKIVKN